MTWRAGSVVSASRVASLLQIKSLLWPASPLTVHFLTMCHSICGYVLPTCFLYSTKPKAVLVRLMPFSRYLSTAKRFTSSKRAVLENSHVTESSRRSDNFRGSLIQVVSDTLEPYCIRCCSFRSVRKKMSWFTRSQFCLSNVSIPFRQR